MAPAVPAAGFFVACGRVPQVPVIGGRDAGVFVGPLCSGRLGRTIVRPGACAPWGRVYRNRMSPGAEICAAGDTLGAGKFPGCGDARKERICGAGDMRGRCRNTPPLSCGPFDLPDSIFRNRRTVAFRCVGLQCACVRDVFTAGRDFRVVVSPVCFAGSIVPYFCGNLNFFRIRFGARDAEIGASDNRVAGPDLRIYGIGITCHLPVSGFGLPGRSRAPEVRREPFDRSGSKGAVVRRAASVEVVGHRSGATFAV